MTHLAPFTADLNAPSLDPMLWARSVAVVGASPRQGSVGNQVMKQLLGGGFKGSVLPVNPSHPEVEGVPTRPSLADLEETPDLVILAVADARLEALLGDAISRGARAATVFSPAQGVAAGGGPLRLRLATMARAAGIPLCGPNGMGFVNVEHGLRATGFFQPPQLDPGTIAFLSHSGSLFSAILHNRRGLRFNIVVSSGLELVTTMDAYLDHVVGLDSTAVVGLFLETIRRPAEMTAALEKAADRDVPVVALKVGRTERARAAAATHSGALAGEDAAYDAFFDAHGVHRVDTMDEMADTLEIFAGRYRATAAGLGAVLDSGGERTLLIDTAHRAGVSLATLADSTKDRLAAVLEDGLEADNPVDAWGTGHGHEDIFESTIQVLAEDPAVGLVAFCVDLTGEADPSDGYVPVITRIAPGLPVPLVVLSNLAAGIDPDQALLVRRMGVPVLEGTRPGLAAIRHLLAHGRRPLRSSTVAPVDDAIRTRWRRRLAAGGRLDEADGLALLADYGMDIVDHARATGPEDAVAAAEAVGYPVAVKTAHAAHKTEVAGIKLGLATDLAVRAAYADLSERLGPDVIVQAMAPTGVEVALGIVRDDQFGPLVVVAAGGALVEVMADRLLALPPVDTGTAADLVGRLRISRLLDGVRGSGATDRAALVEAITRLSAIAVDLGDLLDGLDVNPVIVSPEGAMAVDSLVVARSDP